eukprot:CAMPEP_0183599830 /NCGR_PEP_ID=MMETSP0371-20130417/179629_1 /TAXON_ID=268820 /ORGANISM="Peridinium aciculiferum, Strain PAER-2" /LENGTH=308 /DNA_ID=CAMNT_0025811901 /DNA_START=31 /DNA_END=958 /DNA_ORIENTATION=-
MWNALASSLLVIGFGLATVSIADSTWWVVHTENAHLERISYITLWRKHSDTIEKVLAKASEACQSSDECIEGTFCRVGDNRCWTRGDCEWQNAMDQTHRDCSKMGWRQSVLDARRLRVAECDGPNSSGLLKDAPIHTTRIMVGNVQEGSGSSDAACGVIHAIRVLVVLTALFALSAVPCAPRMHCSLAALLVACFGIACGTSAIILSLAIDLPGSRAGDLGFISLVMAVLSLTVAAVLTFRARRVPSAREQALPGGDATKYGSDLGALELLRQVPPHTTLLKKEVRLGFAQPMPAKVEGKVGYSTLIV